MATRSVSRRDFLRSVGALGGLCLASCSGQDAPGPREEPQEPEPVEEPLDPEPQEPEPAAPEPADRLAVCLFTEPQTLDPALCDSPRAGTILTHIFAGLARWDEQDGSPRVVADLAEELVAPVVNEDGTRTYTYVLREGCAWSDGTALTAHDFAFSWTRAASPGLGAPGSRAFACVKGFSELWGASPEEDPEEPSDATGPSGSAEPPDAAGPAAGVVAQEGEPPAQPDVTEGEGAQAPEDAPADDAAGATAPDATDATNDAPDDQGGDVPPADESPADEPGLAVRAVDDRTLEVTLVGPTPYWEELLATPWLMPVRQDVIRDYGWAEDPFTCVSNGAYAVSGWEHNSVISVDANPGYHGSCDVATQGIEFFLSEDEENRVSNFQNGTWQLVDVTSYPEPSLLDDDYPGVLRREAVAGTCYACWDVNDEILPDASGMSAEEAERARAEVRRAAALLADRSYIAGELAQAEEVPAATFVPWEALGLSQEGYYDVSPEGLRQNFDDALEVLRGHYDYDEASGTVTNAPSLTIVRGAVQAGASTNDYLCASLRQVGIDAVLEASQRGGIIPAPDPDGPTIMCDEALASYLDPLCFLEMWTSTSAANRAGLGTGAHAQVAAYDIDLTGLGLDVAVEGGTWSDTYDVLVGLARVQEDEALRLGLMRRAEGLLMQTGAVCPLVFCTMSLLASPGLSGWYPLPVGVCRLDEATAVA